MNEPLVSVICTARNAAATLEATLQSVVGQSLQDWEMIVVDDGSADDTAAIAESYHRWDHRIRLICTPGLGRGRALNRALDCARAPLVANLDADDLSHPRRLALQLETMTRDPRIVLLCTEIVRISRDERPAWPGFRSPRVEDVTYNLIYSNPVIHSSAMFRRDVLLSLGGYAEDIVIEDYHLWVRMAAHGYRLHKLHLPLAAKRLHDGQTFGTNRNRLTYLRASAQIQSQAMALFGAPRHHRALIWGRFLFGLLPHSLRRQLQDTMRGALVLLCQRPAMGRKDALEDLKP